MSDITILYGCPEGHDARVLAELAREAMRTDKILLHVALDDTRLGLLEELLSFFAPDVKVVSFPAWDCLPYDRVSPASEIVAQRIAALTQIMRWNEESERMPRIVLTTVNAALQRVPPQSILHNVSLGVVQGGQLDLEKMQAFLSANGYTRTETVREPGEFGIRGGIVDMFPAGYENPLRLDLFGDEVESIREFDPATQRSSKKIKKFTLQPATEFALDEESISRFRQGYRTAFGMPSSDDPLYNAVSEGRRYNGMDHWLPLFYEQMDTLFDYLPKRTLSLDPHARRSHTERLGQVEDFFQARKTLEAAAMKKKKKSKDVSLSGAVYHPLKTKALYLEEEEWETALEGAYSLSPFAPPSLHPDESQNLNAQDPKSSLGCNVGVIDKGGRKGRDFANIRALPDGDVFAELKKHIAQLPEKTLIACASEGSKSRMEGLLDGAGIQVELVVLDLDHGFIAPDLAVITEQDVLGDKLVRRARKKKRADNFLTEVSSLSEGDLVVHIDHGVGRFVALETLEAHKTFHDCLKIEYAGGDKLFVPVENIEVLSRFGSEEGVAQLDKLGGAGWQARKARAKKDLMAMADGLLKIAAARKLNRAEKFDISEGLYNEFAARFPYEETEDQERAIGDVIADLANDFPMDRLVCGDVGFGKTEVAMRAAYAAAMNGAQVAVVVPTTLLARQHYQNFLKRFAGTGLRVDQLSRMVSAADTKSAKAGLADGSVSIVIGTHALFGKGIKFANLGLLVIDEEQRFGVKQKERLKELKANVHILTLSATPIPRTLQMSLTGVKEMSLITTPPVDRLAVRTFVLPFDGMVVREALLREHYRGGQSFYVCPRVKDIDEVEEMLRELVPEVKVVTAHGQMTPTELEDRMNAFHDRQYDVLLATNIIESGIDIPTANTMIIHRADMFGLAQLYQIRGRIGRSKLRAYAYLTYQEDKLLAETSMKRLEVMETLDTLGAGFQLASHDMDIRGAGNLLGDKQSGHIKEIGVELYQQMLEEAVAAAREGLDLEAIEADQYSPQINLGMSVLIPDHYVEDLNVRMSLYRRLSELGSASSFCHSEALALKNRDPSRQAFQDDSSGQAFQDDAVGFDEDLEAFAAELIDRFGEIPDEVNNLIAITAIKQMCKKAGVSKIEAGPKGAVITFHKDTPPDIAGLMSWITEKGGAVKLRHDQKLVAIRQWDRPEQRVKGAQRLMKELSGLV